jgi:hypothetical protein
MASGWSDHSADAFLGMGFVALVFGRPLWIAKWTTVGAR